MYAFDTNRGHATCSCAPVARPARARATCCPTSSGRSARSRPHKVAMQPGMPQILGRIGDVPVLGLPGNPVSAFVSFEVFVRPAIRTAAGPPGRAATRRVHAPRDRALTSPPAQALVPAGPARPGGARWTAAPTGAQGSHLITSIALGRRARHRPRGRDRGRPAGTRSASSCCRRVRRRDPASRRSPTSTRRGHARMVDVGEKPVTSRTAVAECRVVMTPAPRAAARRATCRRATRSRSPDRRASRRPSAPPSWCRSATSRPDLRRGRGRGRRRRGGHDHRDGASPPTGPASRWRR
jgi:hypothetical protein